jgi:hypothetical protein
LVITSIVYSPTIRASRYGGCLQAECRGRAKHHRNAAATASGAPKPLGNAHERKVATTGANQRLQVELGPIGATLPMLQSLAAVIETPHVELPAEIPGFSNCLDAHHISSLR